MPRRLLLLNGLHEGQWLVAEFRKDIECALGECLELESCEERLRLGEIRLRGKGIQIDFDRHVPTQRHQFEIPQCALTAVLQRRGELRRLLVGRVQDRLQRSVLGHQFCCGLLSDTVNAFQVVTRVAAHRRVLGVLPWSYPGLFEDSRFVVEGVVRDASLVVQHLDVRVAHQLIGVAVAGDDQHFGANLRRSLHHRCNQIVTFKPGFVEHRDAKRLQHFSNDFQLLVQDVGLCLALSLVFGCSLVSESFFATIEDHDESVRLLLCDQIGKHRHESEDGIGDLTTRRRHVGG